MEKLSKTWNFVVQQNYPHFSICKQHCILRDLMLTFRKSILKIEITQRQCIEIRQNFLVLRGIFELAIDLEFLLPDPLSGGDKRKI